MAAIKEKQLGITATGTAAFSVEQDELLNALLLCAKVVSRSSAIPLLQCIKFDLKKTRYSSQRWTRRNRFSKC